MVVDENPNVMLGSHIVQYAVAASYRAIGALLHPFAKRLLLFRLSENCLS
jgi:hypothetical protein